MHIKSSQNSSMYLISFKIHFLFCLHFNGIQVNQSIYPKRTIKKKCILFQVALFWGNNDWLAHRIDLERIASQLPNVVENYKVKNIKYILLFNIL